MSKIFCISNTLFGYKNYIGFNRFLEESENYFYKELIPFIQKYAKKEDTFIHLGNFFVSKQQLNVKIINSVQNIFENIANILPVYILIGEHDRYTSSNNINTLSIFKNFNNINIVTDYHTLYDDKVLLVSFQKNLVNILNKYNNSDYIITSNNPVDILNYKSILSKYKRIYTGVNKENYVIDNIRCIGSPYQTEPDTINKGLFVLDINTNDEKFLTNKSNSKFTKIHINKISDLENFNEDYFKNNIVDIIVNKELMDNMEFKMKISNYNIQSLTCEDDIKVEDENDQISDFFDVDELILSKISENIELKNEFDNILRINNQ